MIRVQETKPQNRHRLTTILLVILPLCGLHPLGATSITHRVTVRPILTRDDRGNGPAKIHIVENLIDQVYGSAGVDFCFLRPVYYDNTDARDGKKDVDVIVRHAIDAGIVTDQDEVINMLFVNAINGGPAPRGLSQQGGSIAFIAMAQEAPAGQDAFVVAHEAGHNLGLAHAVQDANVPNDVPNIMGDGPFEERVGPQALTDYQGRVIHRSPLVKQAVQCLDVEAAREALIDESTEPFFSNLQRREIAAFTGKTLEKTALEPCRNEARRRFQEAVMAFTKQESEAVTWFANKVSDLLMDDYPLMARQPWKFIKVRDDLCGGMAFTRGPCIILSAGKVEYACKAYCNQNDKQAFRRVATLFAHEQVHVLQRFGPDRFATLYQDPWGFLSGQVEPHPWIVERQVSNPDAPVTNWIVPHKDREGRQSFLWMRTLLKGDHPIPKMGADFMGVAIQVERHGDGYRVLTDDSGEPLHRAIEDYRRYAARFPVVRGLDHPNEIAAYLFADLLLYDYLLAPVDRPGDYDTRLEPHLDLFRRWCKTHLR